MRIGILGGGKMGRWLAHCFVREHAVAIYERDEARRELLTHQSTVESARGGLAVLSSLQEMHSHDPELLINGVTLRETVAAFESVLPYLSKQCMLCDIASVKSTLPAFYEGAERRFVSLHPMFGPTFGDFEALQGENAIIIEESDPQGARLFIDLFASLGVRVFHYSFKKHDEMMAYSLTTPFASSLVFAACLTETAVPGTTFSRHHKIAAGLLSEDDQLLAEVLFNECSLAQIERITGKLEFLKHVIRGRDFEEAARFFQSLRKNVGVCLRE